MTQQQFVQEFKSYPKAQKSVVIRQLLRILEENLKEKAEDSDEISIEEKKKSLKVWQAVLKWKIRR